MFSVPKCLILALHGLAHAADEHRQAEADRHDVAARVEQPDGEVERLVDDHVVGRAHEVDLHLLGHGDEAVAHDFGDDRIGAGRFRFCFHDVVHRQPLRTVMTRSPKASTSSRSPGCSDRGRGMLLDQRRPGDLVAGLERRPVIGRRLDEAGAGEIHRPLAAERRGVRLGAALGDVLERRLSHHADDGAAQADDLGLLAGDRKAVARLMHGIEQRLMPSRSCDVNRSIGSSTVTACSWPT